MTEEPDFSCFLMIVWGWNAAAAIHVKRNNTNALRYNCWCIFKLMADEYWSREKGSQEKGLSENTKRDLGFSEKKWKTEKNKKKVERKGLGVARGLKNTCFNTVLAHSSVFTEIVGDILKKWKFLRVYVVSIHTKSIYIYYTFASGDFEGSWKFLCITRYGEGQRVWTIERGNKSFSIIYSAQNML